MSHSINARIQIVGMQSDMSDQESIEMITTGKWYHKNGKDHIIYDDLELIENQVTHTRVSFDDNSVSIIRSGGTNTHMVFETNISHFTPYETPMGILEMVSSTKSLVRETSENHVELTVTYNLSVDQMDMGTNIFHIQAQRLTDE